MRSLICLGIVLFSLVFSVGVFADNIVAPFAPDIATIKKTGVLSLAIYNANQAPFFSRDAKGNWVGVDIDFANMIAGQLGVKLVIEPAPTFNDVINMVATGKADIGLGLVSITPQRALLVRFSNPYYTFHPYLLVNRLQLEQAGWNLNNVVDEVQDSNKALKLGALASSANILLLQDALPQVQIVTFPSSDAMMRAVANGQIFAAVSDTPEQLKQWLQKNPEAAVTTGMAMIASHTALFGVALPWKEEGLRQWLNIYINYLQMNGVLTGLLQKYGVAQGLAS